jgi:hypothetical protein
VRWRDRTGVFHRDLGDDEHAEIVIADRTYRVHIAPAIELIEALAIHFGMEHLQGSSAGIDLIVMGNRFQ